MGTAKSVFIIEPDEATKELCNLILRDLNLNVVCCQKINDLINEVVVAQPALIIIDEILSEQGSLLSVDYLQSDVRTSSIPIIICSAWQKVAQWAKNNRHAVSFIDKPFDISEFERVVCKLI